MECLSARNSFIPYVMNKITNIEIGVTQTQSEKRERIGASLYRQGGKIVARVRLNGKRTWRSTGTDNPAEARKWLKKWQSEAWMEEHGIEAKGVILHRARVTVAELIDAYIEAGMPTRKMRPKRPATIAGEQGCLRPLRMYFGSKQAAAVALADCDRYRDWRTSGGFFASAGADEQRKKMVRMKKGTRSVDLELTILANVFHLAARRGALKSNPLAGRSRYSVAEDIRHCREVAPTPESLKQIEYWLRVRNEDGAADVVCFLAYSGLRIGEALSLDWEAVNWGEKVIHVHREKRGIVPFVPILPEMEALLRQMQKRAASHLLFPSPFDPNTRRDDSAIRHRLTAACRSLQTSHVTPHGLRSYFVTQAREGGLSDAEIAMLIGDKTGPAIIAHTYGDIRPDHLLKQAQRIRLTVQAGQDGAGQGSSPENVPGAQSVSPCSAGMPKAANTEKVPDSQGV
jgi:integrase